MTPGERSGDFSAPLRPGRNDGELARALIEARGRAGLTQSEPAERMETTQSVMARLESGRVLPSTRTLEKFARATGTRLRIAFDPA